MAIIGIMEAKKGVCLLKDMVAGTQEEVKLDELLNFIVSKIGPKALDFYSPSKDFVIEEPKVVPPEETLLVQ